MTIDRRTFLTAAAAAAASGALAAGASGRGRAQQFQTFAKSELTIVTGADGGAKHRFAIELAETPEQMAQGLMFRRSMASDAGMLFDYHRVQPVSFWMKNTLIPLDMIFIEPDGRIAGMHERAVPLSLTPIQFDQPVRAVLELNGGTADRLGIKPGDHVLYAGFNNAS
ncbi:MAG TPA: DUF192 domain-containing protein [Stellaceae bacterium]